MRELAKQARAAATKFLREEESVKEKMFESLVVHLENNMDAIISENQKDLQIARENKLEAAMIDRLELSKERILQMMDGVREISKQKQVVGSFFEEQKNAAGLMVKKQRIPLGVILMIFESRPNVVVDCAALAIKSSNAIILKGGREAKHSNEILGKIITEAISPFTDKNLVQVLSSDNRKNVEELLKLDEFIDVVIPRGGEGLIQYVSETAKMPVIAHYKGLCHMYIDDAADLEKALNLVVNAKTQRPGVCNAIETLLVHKNVLSEFAPKLVMQLKDKNTELRVDEAFMSAAKDKNLKIANTEDWDTEYLANILSIRTVENMDHAIEHIARHGSKHSEAIVTEDQVNSEKFLRCVDASCVMINASTRFNDGGQLGLGAELGISTTKIHAYGPMGAEQMTSSRFVVEGEGHIRS
ncbi:MAG: glutamate-5-semialdehyde dehydrogenase [Bdellovibrionota bacterium]|nr:glutamate-5-semialdehyde dehydrogenase [Bdellovibrionota bacterium]